MAPVKHDPVAETLGIIVFLGGIGLVVLSFFYAFQMFRTPTPELLGVEPGSTIELASLGSQAIGVLIRIFLLLLMTALGSVIANRGIRMYASGRAAILKANPDVKEIDKSVREEVDDTEEEAEPQK